MYIDPRGPNRKIVSVEIDPQGGFTKLHLDCGHVSEVNQIYTYLEGDDSRCMTCKRALNNNR
jgi:hypothetical protein